MSSPRTSWSGAIQLGMLNVPISIAPAAKELKETSLKDICTKHKAPVSRNERCDECEGRPEGKTKGIQIVEGQWRVFDSNEYIAIENATKSDVMEILDVQDVSEFPLHLGMGTYFVRPDKNAKGSEMIFALFASAIEAANYGCVVKWGTATREKLMVVYVKDRVCYMTMIPMPTEARTPAELETVHHAVEVDSTQQAALTELLSAHRSPSGFEWDSYEDMGLLRRQRAVERVLDGNTEAIETVEQSDKPATDIMDAIKASLDQVN